MCLCIWSVRARACCLILKALFPLEYPSMLTAPATAAPARVPPPE